MYVLRIQNIIFIFYTVFPGFAPLEVICKVLCSVVLYNSATADHDIVIMCPECSPDTSTPPYWAPLIRQLRLHQPARIRTFWSSGRAQI